MVSIKLNMRGIPASRPRVTRHGTYNSPKYDNYKKALRLYFGTFKKMSRVPLRVELSFFFEHPKTMKGRKYPTVPMDADNLAKGVLDAGNGVLYEDDALIEELMIIKKYAMEDAIFITIKEI